MHADGWDWRPRELPAAHYSHRWDRHIVQGKVAVSSNDLAVHRYHLAGPPSMIETIVRILMVEHTVPARNIHYDRFF